MCWAMAPRKYEKYLEIVVSASIESSSSRVCSLTESVRKFVGKYRPELLHYRPQENSNCTNLMYKNINSNHIIVFRKAGASSSKC